MKILQLCKKFPYPLKDGESLAVTYMAKSLQELGSEVTLLSMNTSKHFCDVSKLPKDFDHYKAIHLVEVDNTLRIKDAFLNLFSADSYHISRFISKDFEYKLELILKHQEFDIIQLETLYLTPYIPIIRKYSNAIISLRAHNIEHEIWQRCTDNASIGLKKIYLQHLTDKLRRYEIAQLDKFDILTAITKRDLSLFQKLGFKGKSKVAPIGLDLDHYPPDFRSYSKPLSLCFIGSMDWTPNIEGIEWFLKKVVPTLSQEFPLLNVHIAGRNTPEYLLKTNIPTVKIHGEVDKSVDFINQHSVMIVPLFSGSGMRAKILEAMALGKTVITTALGLEGISASHQKEVLLAETEEDFLRQIKFCQENPAKIREIGIQARQFIERYYDYKIIGQQLLTNYQELSLQKRKLLSVG